MEFYSVFLKRAVLKDLSGIPKKDAQLILKRIDLLKVNPRPPGTKKLASDEKYRIRQGNYRIIYSIQDRELTVWVVKVGHRKKIYKH